ncbi:MAG: thiamine pyrophosphate-binding protein [Caldimonas sp.]
MSSSGRGADALVRTLQAAGTGRIFTLSGNHVMPVFDATVGSGIELIHTRHEAAAVHMADAWSRITGEVGVALVTGGPGHGNAVSALYTARMAEAPIVLLSGHAPNGERGMGAFQEMAQADMAAPVTKASWTCTGADAIAGDIARAFRIARSGRPGPVHLSLPSDALEAAALEAAALPASAFRAETKELDANDVGRLLARLGDAERPLILVGPESLTRRGRAAADALEDATGIPVIGMESPRGIADPSLGAFAERLAQSDCLLLVGKRLDFTLRFGRAPAIATACRFLQVDADGDELERSRRAVGERLEVALVAEAPATLAALARWSPPPGARHERWRDDVRRSVAYRPAAWDDARSTQPGRLHPVAALRPLQALLDSHPDAVLVSDGGEIGQWAQACLTAPHRLINGVAGAIGSALPYAAGARCAVPGAPVIAVLGDGTCGFHIAEFDTALRYRLPFVAVVGNDARWNAEYQIQLRDYGPDRLVGCELEPTRYDRVAAAFGAHGEHVDATEEMLPAAQRALDAGIAACINVMIEGVPAPNVKTSTAG